VFVCIACETLLIIQHPDAWVAGAPIDDVQVVVNEIKTVLTGAVKSTQGLVGLPLDVVLRTVDGVVLTLPQVASAVAGLVLVRPYSPRYHKSRR